jgi:GNAT superfamily N-acetyltransferase
VLPGDGQSIRDINIAAWENSEYAEIYSRLERDMVYVLLATIVGDWETGSALLEVVVANADGRDVAIAALKQLPNGDGLVESFYVHPNHWRHKVGTALWAWIVGEFRNVYGIRKVRVYALDRNAQAKAFYRSVCGEPTGVVSVAHLVPSQHDERAIEFACG